MNKTIITVMLPLVAAASGAVAAEFSAHGTLSESLTGSNNLFMDTSPRGNAGQSVSAIDLDFLAVTPTTKFDLDTKYSYQKYFGQGVQPGTLAVQTPMSATFAIDHTADPLTKYNFVASWQRTDVATTSLQQTGVFAGTGSVDTYTATGGFKRELDALDTLAWSATASTVSYSDPTQTPYVDYSSSTTWTHRVSEATSLITSLNVDWLMVDNSVSSERLYWNPMSGVQSQLTKRLFFYGTAGFGFVNAYQHGVTPVGPPAAGFQETPGATTDWLVNANMNYKVFSDTTASLTASRAISPTVFGQLLHIESVSFTVHHTVNDYSDLTFVTQFSQTKDTSTPGSTGASSDFFSASVNYSYLLAREWRTNLSYTYSQRDAPTGRASASTVALSLNYDFTLFGKPGVAEQKSQSDIARQDIGRAQQALPFAGIVTNFVQ